MSRFDVWPEARRKALVVGINRYECCELHPLTGCVNDAEAIAALLEEFNFAVVRLVDQQATRADLLQALQALLDQSRPGDEVVFFFAGHGSRILTDDHGPHETLVPFDSHRSSCPKNGDNQDITDREIYGWILRLSEVTPRITLWMDACRSGGIVRSLQSNPRGVAPDTRAGILQDKVAFLLADGDGSQATPAPRPPSDRYVLLSACHAREFCREMDDPDTDRRHGIFSLSLLQELRQTTTVTTWRELAQTLHQRVASRNPDQRVQLEGAVDREIFGGREFRPSHFLPVTAIDGDEVRLGGGTPHGVVRGSQWRLFPARARRPRGDDLGIVRVDDVGAAESGAVLVARRDGPDQPTVGCRAFETSRPLIGKIGVLVDPASGTAGERLKDALQTSVSWYPVDDPESAKIVLKWHPDRPAGPPESGTWRFVSPHLARQTAPPVRWNGNAPDLSSARLLSRLEHLGHYHALDRLEHPNPETSLARWVDVELERRPSGGSDWHPSEPGETYRLGDLFGLRLRRTAPESGELRAIYVAVVNLTVAGGIQPIYPTRSRDSVWETSTLEIGFRPDDVLEVGLPPEYPFPGDPPFNRAQDTVIVVLTSALADLATLATGEISPLRGGSKTVVSSILRRSLGLSVLRSDESNNPLDNPSEWGVIACRFEITSSNSA